MSGQLEGDDDPKPVGDHPDISDQASPDETPGDDPGASIDPADPTERPEDQTIAGAIERELGHRPEVAEVVGVLVDDHENHPLQLSERIIRERTRGEALGDLRRLADSDLLSGRPLSDYIADHPGHGPLFDATPDDVNLNADGVSRKQAFIDAQKEIDPVRSLGPDLNPDEYDRLDNYRQHLQYEVEARVVSELEAFAPDGATVSARTKYPDGILDKIERMREGHAGRDPRPDYEVGDVIDAVGARVNLPDTESLSTFYERVKEEYGTGDGGRILEIENFYAEPKSGSPAYRVIPMVVTTTDERGEHPFELQLTTRLASTAADLGHNTLYKDYHSLRPEVLDTVRNIQDEAVAIEHEETRHER